MSEKSASLPVLLDTGADASAPPPTPIYIAACCPHGRDISPIYHQTAYVRSVLASHSHESRPILIREFSIIGDEYARSRNGILSMVKAAEVEQGYPFDYLFWVDDDIVLPEDVLTKLLSHNLPVVSGLYVTRKPPHLPVAYTKANDPRSEGRYWNVDAFPPNALMEVEAVGHGCLMVRREVYNHIAMPAYAWRPRDWKPEDVDVVREDENTLGEDFFFCARVKSAGYLIHLDTGVRCGHVGNMVYTIDHFLQSQPLFRRLPEGDRLNILFLPAPAPKPWDWNTMHLEGLGGSESAVAYLAHRLANRHHHNVYVCSGAAFNCIENVNYRPNSVADVLLARDWDVIIVSRWWEKLRPSSENQQVKLVVAWAHDLFQHMGDVRYVYNYSNVFVTLSPFHAAVTYGPYPENDSQVVEAVMPNGVDVDLFQDPEERVPGRLLWTSNPNRGLPTAVKIFKQLKKRHPHLEFHVYGRMSTYGWDPGLEAPWIQNIDEPGVYIHTPLPKQGLAKELLKSWVWFYPTHWPESFSIAALEAQAAGTPVVANPYAALASTVVGGILTYDFQQAFDLLMDPPTWELASLRGKEQALKWNWDTISDEWETMLRREIARQERLIPR